MRIIIPIAIAILAASSTLAAPVVGNGPAAGAPAGQAANPDVPPPQPTKPTVGTSDTATGAATPPAPGTDTSTSAPGEQAESTKNGALGADTGTNVPHRHHGPKRPATVHDRSDAAGPPANATSK